MKKRCFWVSLCVSMLMMGSITAANATDIGVAWAGKSGMAKRVTAGFDQGMKEMAPDIKIEYQKELGSIDDLAVVVGKWEKEKSGMVLLRVQRCRVAGSESAHHPHVYWSLQQSESAGSSQGPSGAGRQHYRRDLLSARGHPV